MPEPKNQIVSGRQFRITLIGDCPAEWLGLPENNVRLAIATNVSPTLFLSQLLSFRQVELGEIGEDFTPMPRAEGEAQ